MKSAVRVLIAVVALATVILVIKQSNKSISGPSGHSTPAPQRIGGTFTSAENGYSHRIPEGWITRPATPSKAAMIAAPESSGLSSTMVTAIEPYDGTLRSYVDDAKIQLLRESAVKKKVIKTDFTTDTGIPGYKLKLQKRTNNVDVALTMYFFEAPGNKKIVVTCTAPAQFEAQLEPLFDDCMKTFALSSR